MLVSFIGGEMDKEILNLSDEELVLQVCKRSIPLFGTLNPILTQVHKDLTKILLKGNPPAPKVIGVKRWSRAIPQYEMLVMFIHFITILLTVLDLVGMIKL